MPDYKQLHQQAIELRQQGLSTKQIGTRLGLSGVTVWRWVRDVPFEGFSEESLAEQLEARRDPAVYERAIELRKEGYSYNLISQKLGVNKSTLSGWLKNITFAEYHPDVQERVERASHAMAQARIEKAKQSRAQAEQEATEEIHYFLSEGFSDREMFIAGLMLYWGEGSKYELSLGMTNSDPAILETFVYWVIRYVGVSLDNMRGTVFIYPDINEDYAKEFWSRSLSIPLKQFYKIQIDVLTNKAIHKKGKLPFGVCHVRIVGKGSKYQQLKVLKWLDLFREQLPQYMRV